MPTTLFTGNSGRLFFMASAGAVLVVGNLAVFFIAWVRYKPPPPPPPPPIIRPAEPPAPPPYNPLSDTDVDRLTHILEDKETHGTAAIRALAARRLGELQAQTALPVLLNMLADWTAFSSAEIRQACAFALGQIGDPAAVPGLQDAMRKGNLAAIAALGQLGTPDAVDALTSALSPRSPQNGTRPQAIQVAMVNALGHAKDARALTTLTTLLTGRATSRSRTNGTDPALPLAAIAALEAIRDPQAIPALLTLDRSSVFLKQRMAAAVETLLLHQRTVTQSLLESFDDPANPHGWGLKEGYRRSIRLQDGRLSIFSSQIGERVASFPHQTWTGDWIASVQLHFVKGSGVPLGGLLFGKQEEREYACTLSTDSSAANAAAWQLRVVRRDGSKEKRLLQQSQLPRQQGWNTLTVRNIDTVVSVLWNNIYLGSFRIEQADGQIGLCTENDNHVWFDEFHVQTVHGEAVFAKKSESVEATEEKQPVRKVKRQKSRQPSRSGVRSQRKRIEGGYQYRFND